jgi:CRP-like cAMP-binding protein
VSIHQLPYLTPNDWSLINARAHRRVFALGDEMIHEGNMGEKIFIVRRGEATVEIAVSTKRSALATLGPGDICGEMAFLERGKTTATVVARETEVEADEIAYGDLRDLFDAFPRLASRFYHSLAVLLARRLEYASRELAREMAVADRRK